MLTLAFAALLLAQTPAPPMFAFALDDGSLLRASPITPALTVRTAHGDLSVKWSDLRKLTVGPRLTGAESARYEAALKLLASETHTERERGMGATLALGPRAAHRLKAIGKADMEVRRRADMLLKALGDKHGPDRLRGPAPDAFATPTLTGTGAVAEKSVRLKSAYLGEVDLDLAYVRSIMPVASADGETFTVPAADPISWVDTGLDISGSARITATGVVDLWPQQPGQYTCGPAGYNQTGKNSQCRAGALVYRVGPGSEVPLVLYPVAGRDKESGTATGTGRLYLGVVAAPWNQAPQGSYTVRVYPE